MIDRASLPDFELHATGNQRFQLSAFKGQPFVLYFYPSDNTPGCTVEGQQFRDLHDEPFELLSDPDEKACEIFGVMKMKNMYGRQVRAGL
jgi:peroxiredoxin Q/BCP